MRRLNSDVSGDRSFGNFRTPYLEIFVVGTIQFFLSLLIVSYGVFLMEFVLKDLYNVKSSLWVAFLLVGLSKMTNPWAKAYCKHLDIIKRKVHKRNIIVAVVILCSGLAAMSFFNTLATIMTFYGVCGGVFSSIISVHLNFATAASFKNYPQLFSSLEQFTKSFCLLATPHLVLFFTNNYGTHAFLVVSGILLNIIPFSLFLRKRKTKQAPLSKFQTIDKLSIEMTDLHLKQPIREPSLPSDNDDDGDEEEDDDSSDEEVPQDEKKPPPINTAVVQTYYENVGVKILPNIPEESDDEEDDDINEINSKRLSRISAILQGINENTRRNSNLSVNNLFQPEEVAEEAQDALSNNSLHNQKRARCFSINSSIVFELKLRKRRIKSVCYRNFARCAKSLRTFQFYPAVISSSINTTISTIIFATAPYLMFLNIEKNEKYSTNEETKATFLLTIIGFSWLFFLAGYPIFSKLSPLKTKILFLAGLSILGLSLFIVHRFDYDNFVFFSLTFGLGHGIVSYAENVANEDFFGKVKWKLLHGALEIATGVVVILVYLVIYFLPLEVNVLLSHAYWFYVFDVGLWIVAYLVKKIIVYVKNTGRYNIERYPDLNF